MRSRRNPDLNALSMTGKIGWKHTIDADLEEVFPASGQLGQDGETWNARASARSWRREFQGTLARLILRNFPRSSLQTIHTNADRSFPLSGKYIRVRFTSGARQWLAIAVAPQEGQEGIDGLLSHGLLWREYARTRKSLKPAKLILIAPTGKTLVLVSRLAWIAGTGHEILLMEMDVERSSLRFVDLSDCGNLDTALTRVQPAKYSPRFPGPSWGRSSKERCLQDALQQQVTLVNPALDQRHVYPQVPAFLAGTRGMIDILTVTKQGRLAILELKVSEDVELPMQGLDYWLRVRWHQQRGEFQKKGYFPGLVLSAEPPLLYFVGPLFRYHDSFPKISKYIVPAVPICQVGINENWSEGVQVLRRRFLNPGSF
ncbi:MAG: hypothetical protein U0V70_08735 [Terriglobia bacterium]